MNKHLILLIVSFYLAACGSSTNSEAKADSLKRMINDDTTAAAIANALNKPGWINIYTGRVPSGKDSADYRLTVYDGGSDKMGTFKITRKEPNHFFSDSGRWQIDNVSQPGKLLYVLKGISTDLPAYYLVKDNMLITFDNETKKTGDTLTLLK